MPALSNKTVDVLTWIEKIIDSCNRPSQEPAVINLIRLFELRLASENHPSYLGWAIVKSLKDKLTNKKYGNIN
jgi:hypothetical protein